VLIGTTFGGLRRLLERGPLTGIARCAAAEATAVHLVDMHWLLITRIAQALSVMGELE
jgi:hypothetical protein